MVATIEDAKAHFESEGLHVSRRADHLWIAINLHEVGFGITMADDSCALTKRADGWIATFPAEGMWIYQMPGSLPDLVATISAVIAQSRRTESPLQDAFRQIVSDPDQYVLGKSLAHV